MRFDEFIDRLLNHVRFWFNSESGVIRILSRLLALALLAGVISTVAPTLADELSSSPSLVAPLSDTKTAESVSPANNVDSATSTISSTPSPTTSPIILRPTIANPTPSALAEPSDTKTPTTLPGIPLDIQPRYELRIPPTVAIDPRASSYFLPRLYASTGNDQQYTLACISGSSGVTLDIQIPPGSQITKEGNDLISGNKSTFLMISSSASRVINIVNSGLGLQVSSRGSGLSAKTILFQFVAVTRPVIDSNFCQFGNSYAATTFRPLGLEQSTVKGSGTLK